MMKYILILLSIITSGSTYGQSDEIAYQTIITDIQDVPIRNIDTEVQINVREGIASGPITYSETHNATTGLRGEIELSIGSGNPVNTSFDDINWETINYIELLVKPSGSSVFLNNGTIEMLSVPYAIFATKLGCDQGCPGAPGIDGEDGLNGPDGLNGINGIHGPTGRTGPQGQTGQSAISTLDKTDIVPINPEQGEFYLDDGTNRTDGNIGFRYYFGTTWINI